MMAIALAVLAVIGVALGLLLGAEALGRLRRLYQQGGEQHWDLLGDRVGLLHGHDVMGGHVLDGQRRGVWLHVEAEGAWMVVRGRIEVPMPTRFSVTHRSFGSGDSLRVGSPILDGLVRIQGDTPTARLLQDPEVAGALLAVVHAWPGSFIDERHVTLRYPDALGRQLEERCQEVIELVEVLRRAARRCPPGQQVVTMEMLSASS